MNRRVENLVFDCRWKRSGDKELPISECFVASFNYSLVVGI